MDIEKPKMWTCKKYELSVLESTAEAFCAKRFEASLEGHHAATYSSCVNCDRGAIMYELGKHKERGQGSRGKGPGETKQAKTETIQAKGETTMATFQDKKCDVCDGNFTPTGSRQTICTKCKPSKKAGAKKNSVALPARSSASKPLELAGGGGVSISIDLSRYPKLHSRLVMIGLNTVLAEMETKA